MPTRSHLTSRIRTAALAACSLAACSLAACSLVAIATPAQGIVTRPAHGMVAIPAGRYAPLYVMNREGPLRVAPFAIDRHAVTRGEFLRWLASDARWRRGVVRPVFAERGYLADWPSTLDAGDEHDRRRPVTSVSWFAARAYCAAQGKRLPTVDEWEYVAAADERSRSVEADPAFRQRLLALYASRRPGAPAEVGSSFTNRFGVADMHGLVWEWTLDFNSAIVADDSRASGSGQDARDHHLYCASAAIGARDPSDYPAFARFAVRAGLTARSTVRGVGFRCAASLA